MLTWLILVARIVARTRGESRASPVIGQVGRMTITSIGSTYESSAARVLRRRGGGGIVHAWSPPPRDHPAVALAAHQDARGGARRCGSRPSVTRRLAHSGGPHAAARGQDGAAS